MIRPMMGRRVKPRKFDMPLRYYNPEEEEKRRRRIQLKTRSLSSRKRQQGQNMRIIIYAAGLAMVIYIISVL
jgi:hypothetical protein